MKITRLYTGSDQKSYFEDIELKFGGDQKILSTDSRPATMAVFRCVPAGRFSIVTRRRVGNISLRWLGLGRSRRAMVSREFSNLATSCSPRTRPAKVISRACSATGHVFMTVPLAD
jgi:hypothetical protein